jgi:hypothetical protein
MKSFFAMTATLLVALSACSDGEQTCEPPPDDGKYHPEPNGERLAEQPACDQVYAAIDARRSALMGCVVTHPTCPNFLASKYGAGKEYDVGTLDACVVYIQSATCDQLKAPHDCVLTFYPEPEEACAE